MAVRGLDVFRERFVDYEDSFVLIGGAASDAWFAAQGLSFRATLDLDIVLVIEAILAEFVSRFRDFVDEGEYKIRTRSEGGYRNCTGSRNPETRPFPENWSCSAGETSFVTSEKTSASSPCVSKTPRASLRYSWIATTTNSSWNIAAKWRASGWQTRRR